MQVGDPIAKAMQAKPDNTVVATARAGAAQEAVSQKTNPNSTTNQADMARLFVFDPDAFFRMQTNASAGRTTVHKPGEQRKQSANEQIAKGPDVSELLANGNSAATTRLTLLKTPIKEARGNNERLPQRVVRERNSALLVATGATPKYAKTDKLDDKKDPLAAVRHEKAEGHTRYFSSGVQAKLEAIYGNAIDFFG